MTRHEEQQVSALPDDELLETKYKRLGHIDNGKMSDTLAIYCFDQLKGDVLGKRWKYKSSADFINAYGDKGVWSVTGSYHGFFYEGTHLFRIWTDAGKDSAHVDISSHLFPILLPVFTIDSIPFGSHTKCKPMVYRIEMNSTKDIDLLIQGVRTLYKDMPCP